MKQGRNRAETNLLIDDQVQMGEIKSDTNRLPFSIVKVGPKEDAFPFVEQTGMKIQLAVE